MENNLTYVNDKGVLVVTGVKSLLQVIKRHLKYTTISIIGNAGTGKTTLMQSLKDVEELGIDEVIIFRLQGLSSEDFRIPVVNKTVIEKDGKTYEDRYIEFTNVGIFKEIIDNPDKKFLLILDEITRASRDVAPLLFSILEGKLMDGIKRDNLYIITAFNDGEDYIMNFDFEDPALRRRQIFVEYNPTIEDFKNFIRRHDYHQIIQEIAEHISIDYVINHKTIKDKEQTTTFGSWDILNNVLKDMEKNEKITMDYNSLRDYILSFGALYFNDKTTKKIIDTLTILESLNAIDYQEQIIDKLGLLSEVVIYDKKGKVYNKDGKEKALAIKTLNFIKKKTMEDPLYFGQNGLNIVKNFEFEQALMLSLIGQIKLEIYDKNISLKEKEKYEKKVFNEFVNVLNNCVKENREKYMPLITEFKKICDLRK